MERPFFNLAKKPRKTMINYEVGGTIVKVFPVNEFGIATIWEADILIWAATQITETIDREGEASPKMQFHPYNLLKGIRRPIGGDHYKRIQGTREAGGVHLRRAPRGYPKPDASGVRWDGSRVHV